MPAERRRSRVAQAGASGRQTIVNHISGAIWKCRALTLVIHFFAGGRGGSGGDGHANGTGGAGGHGMGPSLSFDISVGHFTMHNNVHGDEYVGPDSCFLPDAFGTATSMPEMKM